MHNPKTTTEEPIALPEYGHELGHFVGRLRLRLFPSLSKAARYFRCSHSTISRYENDVLRPPLGYIANLAKLYSIKLMEEGHPADTGQRHFVRELNRAVRHKYATDEAMLNSWAELCAIADQFIAARQMASTNSATAKNTVQAEKPSPQPPWQRSPKGASSWDEPVEALARAFLSAEAEKEREDRNRQALLNLVKTFWIDGILAHSLYNSVLLTLGLETRQQAVYHPWELLIRTPQQAEQLLPPETSIFEVYQQTGQSLLILGEPGAGKTTMLLALARELIAQAEAEPHWPIPVIFNLASWTDDQPSLGDWLVEELATKYHIPHRVGRPWLDSDALLPLLDGLDEVALSQREGCVQAINQFQQEHWVPLVVCSRLADYESLSTHLTLKSAVLLRPLTPPQIERYLDQLGPSVSHIWPMLQRDHELRKTSNNHRESLSKPTSASSVSVMSNDSDLLTLAQTPLMLNIIILAYEQALPQPSDAAQTSQSRLFEKYVERMYARKGQRDKPFTDEQTTRWLAKLAWQMRQRSQSIYLIEQMQPDWLGRRARIWLYIFISRMGSMLPGGIWIALATYIAGIPLLLEEGSLLGQPKMWVAFGLLLGGVNGLMLVALDGGRYEMSQQGWLPTVPLWVKSLCVGMLFGWVDGFIFGLFGSQTLSLLAGVVLGLAYGLTIEAREHHYHFFDEIQTVEMVTWSWPRAAAGTILGGLMGLVMGVIGAVIIGANPIIKADWASGPLMQWVGEEYFVLIGALFGGCLLSLAGAVYQGSRSEVVEAKIKPNQGMWLSVKHAVIAWLAGGLLIGCVGGFLFGLCNGFQYSLPAGQAFFLCFGSLAALWYGGFQMIQHYTLRLLLWYFGDSPVDYVQFLDYATERIFLRKVGGGYVFVHRLLLEHFASLHTE